MLTLKLPKFSKFFLVRAKNQIKSYTLQFPVPHEICHLSHFSCSSGKVLRFVVCSMHFIANLGSKSKTQRFKNRKRAEIWKQRSKSAERADSASRLSDEFEEKLREWSVKQGYHPTYYSEIRASHGSVVLNADSLFYSVCWLDNDKNWFESIRSAFALRTLTSGYSE